VVKVNAFLSQGPQLNNGNVRRSIGRIPYAGGQPASASAALELAVNDIFSERSGAREGVNKVQKKNHQ